MSQYQPGGYAQPDPNAAPPAYPAQPASVPVYSTPQPYGAAQVGAQYAAPYGSTGHPQYAVAAAAPSKGLSITGLIIGIASMVGFSWTFLMPIAGIIISAIALNKEPAGKSMAMWGLILSIGSLILVIIGSIVMAVAGFSLLGLLPFLFAAGGY